MKKQTKYLILAAIIVGVLAIGLIIFFATRQDDISYTVEDTLPDGGGKQARVILLGGQSNASGCSRDEYLKTGVSSEKYTSLENGFENVYINYFASNTNVSPGFVKSSTKQGEAGGFFGPELGLAAKLNELYPDETFFIIKWAWGDTNLYDQWLSPSSNGKTGKLYQHFVAYVEASMEYLLSKNYDVKIEGMCWMQGESDSFSTKNATNYETHLRNLIQDMRKEFSRYTDDDGMAFIDATINDNPVFWVYCDMVNASKQKVAEDSPLNVLIDTNIHGLSCKREPIDSPDLAHFDAMSQLKLGYLFAYEVAKFIE